MRLICAAMVYNNYKADALIFIPELQRIASTLTIFGK